jgi:hypothetical protein
MKLLPSLVFAAACLLPMTHAAPVPQLESYNIVWDSPSGRAADSMPLSGWNLGLNVWVEGNDILLLAASPNCQDERGMQVKLGLIRLRFDAPVFAKEFRQELRLAQSEIVIKGRTADDQPLQVKLWCETGATVAHAQLVSQSPVGLMVSYETWSGHQATHERGGIQWVRRLPDVNQRRQQDMKAQGALDFANKVPDPLSKLTLGGRIDAPGLIPAVATPGSFHEMPVKVCAMKTAEPVTRLDLTLAFRMEQDATLAGWQAGIAAESARATRDREKSRVAALAWWSGFWQRSHITIAPQAGVAPAEDQPWQAARNYQLIRYMLGANPSGRAMTLFNGGLFACTENPDRRNWEGCQYMAQNQRLVYWPMLRSGDFDLLRVALDFYRDRIDVNRAHVRKFHDVEGIAWHEPFGIFGLDAIGTTKEGRSKPAHLRYHHVSGMEFSLMMLQYGSYAGKSEPRYLDAAEGIINYHDNYYQKLTRERTGKPLDDKGKLVIYPSDALEIYHGCTNNTDVLAALHAITRDLLALPAGALPQEKRAFYQDFRKRLPDFPIREQDGRKYFAAAESWETVYRNQNMEFPQMYVCFPFTILSLGRSDMRLAKNTWEIGAVGDPIVQKQNQCWYQTAINFARMGETGTAARLTREKLLHPGARFPTFYRTHFRTGGDFCHMPDTDHGGCSMIALQEMLMQVDGRRILLGPAWPEEWDCGFKLHAPYQTIVEGSIRDGKVHVTRVSPASRQKDIEIFPLRTSVEASSPPTPTAPSRN